MSRYYCGVLMGLPKDIADLIERFDRNRESYKSGQYNEMLLRQEFLDPLFAALGWDMNNQQGYAEAGPNPQKWDATIPVAYLITKNKIENCSVGLSRIPYRGW